MLILTCFFAHELCSHSKHNKRQVWRKLCPAAQKRGFARGSILGGCFTANLFAIAKIFPRGTSGYDFNLLYRPRSSLSWLDNKPLVRGKLCPAAQKRGFARGSIWGSCFAANLSFGKSSRRGVDVTDFNRRYRPRSSLSLLSNKPLVRGKLSPAAQGNLACRVVLDRISREFRENLFANATFFTI